ncbi:hypothetical protein RNJ44_03539 [Nakaseomyces bracarensis]|uniref:NAD-dependent epimerase/dehydratase domain-containing protein n=1 Tax=Nakaseomyces bracarensis TaxID=273131 RepID=A0ABR4NXD0_9SACH
MSIFVSGATGFIAQHVVRQLLQQNYRVLGSVRSIEKGKHLKEVVFNNNKNFEYTVVGDISKEAVFDPVFEEHKDIEVVLHTASPFRFDVNNIETELLVPAVNGTRGILESIKRHAAKSVERVVITSSMAAMGSMGQQMSGCDNILNEESWNDDTWQSCQQNPFSGYCASKKFAEKAAWDFYRANQHEVKFKMTAINPVYVFGPQNYIEPQKKALNTSSEIINSLLHTKPGDEIPEMVGGQVDVRDVAKAHLLAFQRDKLVDKRVLMYDSMFTAQTLLDSIHRQFPELKDKIATGAPGSQDALLKQHITIDNSKTRDMLDFDFIPMEQDVYDTVSQILRTGL